VYMRGQTRKKKKQEKERRRKGERMEENEL
jgi:hypothetical protein